MALRGVPHQATKTDGFLCETLGSAAAVAARFQDLSGRAVAAGARILQALLVQAKEAGPLPQACASAAASVLGQSLIAMGGNRSLALAGGAKGKRSMERGDSEGELEWMLSLEAGMDKAIPSPRPPLFSIPPHLRPALQFYIYRKPSLFPEMPSSRPALDPPDRVQNTLTTGNFSYRSQHSRTHDTLQHRE